MTTASATVQSTQLAAAPALRQFCDVMGKFVLTGSGETQLETAIVALASEVRGLGYPPERILTAMGIAQCRPHLETDLTSRRYTEVLRRMFSACFSAAPAEPSPVHAVSGHVDVEHVDALLPTLEPSLSRIEHELVLLDSPTSPAARLTVALRSLLLQRGVTVNDPTFAFLSWKVSLDRTSTAEQRRDVAGRDLRRTITDAEGHRWDVFPMIEGLGWSAGVSVKRENWLCFETASERRYLVPIPRDWFAWTDDELRAALDAAPIDKRRD